MSIRNCWLLCCFVVFFLPVSAQEFVTLDWRELPAAQTLPVVTHEFPLEDDFRSCAYQVEIEFPEYQKLDNAASVALQARLDSLRLSPDADGTFADGLPASPQIISRAKVSAHRGFLSIRLVPVVRREGSYQRLNSFKLSVKPVLKQERVGDVSVRNMAFPAAGASRKGDMASSGKLSLKECTTSLLASGRWAKVRVRNT